MKKKRCKNCNILQPRNEYRIDFNYKDDYNPICNTCHANWDNFISDEDRREIARIYRDVCVVCGEDDWISLAFHHIKDKLFGICDYKKKVTKQMLMDEIDKCIILCQNCHTKYHWGKRFCLLTDKP